MEDINLMLGDNIESLKKLNSNSVDSIVTDPPYGLSFMNKKWDYQVPSVEFWKEVYRVLKPGGHILSFGGTRTYHRMVVNIEDAGFEIRDQIQWIYGSGFPKSHNIGKAVDKLEGNEREVIAEETTSFKVNNTKENNVINEGTFANNFSKQTDENGYRINTITKGNSDYEGWGTALKPANEPICLARKPLSEKTVAENVIKYSTGGINIDGCRIGYNEPIKIMKAQEGRFPANIIFECICDEVIKGEKGEKTPANYERTFSDDNPSYVVNSVKSGEHYNDKSDIHTNPDCPCNILDEQSGESKSSKSSKKYINELYDDISVNVGGGQRNPESTYDDKGGASRFFYIAKVSKTERNLGLDKNNHPTIKPINLMTYLCRLITPKGGVVLDPFMGSGSSGISALLEGFKFIGMEMDEDYFKIAQARINNFEQYRKLLK